MKHRTSPLFILVAFITAIAALSVAKAILLPLAMSILLTFLFTPVADRLERWRIPRVPAVLAVVGITFAMLGMLGWVVTDQLVQLSVDLHDHEENLKGKIESLRPNSPTLNNLTTTLTHLRSAITQDKSAGKQGDRNAPDNGKRNDPNSAKDSTGGRDVTDSLTEHAIGSKSETKITVKTASPSADATTQEAGTKGSKDAASPRPATAKQPSMAVEVVAPSPSLFSQAQEWISQLVAPLTTIGLVVVLVLFMLLDRENQRSRFVQLFGRSHMHATAEAVHDVAHRVGRYLRMLFLLNAGYGFAVGAGLWVIGVPGAVTWGVLGFSLRFLPYIGPWIAASLPIMVSIAVADGWTQPLLVLGWYIVVELVSNNVVEPLVYGSTTGVSTVGVIISAIFWTWLWGPIGLILSVPMTVCLLVSARYVPQLRFLTILLAESPPLSPAERVYQRLLAFDYHEPLKLAHKQLKDTQLVTFYDDVLLPALVMAENDRYGDLLNDDQAAFVMEATEDMIDDLGKVALGEQNKRQVEDAGRDKAAGVEAVAGPVVAPARVLCIPLRDVADEMASRMLTQLLKAEGFQALSGAAESLTSEMVDQVADSESDIVVISVLPPITPRDSRLLWRRLRNRYPNLPIIVGFWTAENDKDALAEPVEDAASRVVTKLSDALSVARSMAAAQPSKVAKTG